MRLPLQGGFTVRTSAVLPAALAALVLAACMEGTDPGPTPAPESPASAQPTPTVTEAVPGTDEATATAEGTPTPPVGGLPDDYRVGWTQVGTGFDGPLQILPDPNTGDTLVVEQVGRVRTLDGQLVLDLTDRVTSGGERGLLGAAFHPDGSRLYVHYSGQDGATTVEEFATANGVIDRTAGEVVLEVHQPARNHNGGSLLFGPGGWLYLALGDGGGAGDTYGNGQDVTTPLGAILRLDAGTPGILRPAPDNPFAEDGDPRVWLYGVRNPWRIAFDDGWLYVADVGQDAVEEITVLSVDQAAGANLGWPILEGSRCFAEPDCDPEGTVLPTVEHLHADGYTSLIGGVVYRGSQLPPLVGQYLYSDLGRTQLHSLRIDGDGDLADQRGFAADAGVPLGFGIDADGELYLGSASGQVYRLDER